MKTKTNNTFTHHPEHHSRKRGLWESMIKGNMMIMLSQKYKRMGKMIKVNATDKYRFNYHTRYDPTLDQWSRYTNPRKHVKWCLNYGGMQMNTSLTADRMQNRSHLSKQSRLNALNTLTLIMLSNEGIRVEYWILSLVDCISIKSMAINWTNRAK